MRSLLQALSGNLSVETAFINKLKRGRDDLFLAYLVLTMQIKSVIIYLVTLFLIRKGITEMKKCLSCGGECREQLRGNVTVYVCKWCGCSMTSDEMERAEEKIRAQRAEAEKIRAAAAAKKAEETSRVSASASPAPAAKVAEQRTQFSTATVTAVPNKAPVASPLSVATPFAAVSGKEALSGEELFEKAIPSVVEIFVQSVNSSAAASGFVISSKGLVLTNAHAVLDEYGKLFEKIFVRSGDKYYSAYPLAIGEPRANQDYDTIDLCLLFVEGLSNLPAVSFADVNLLKNGQKVYLIGNSLGEGTCITSGIISDKDRLVGGLSYPYIMTDAAANPGNSGGPLFSEYGEVIGVLVAGITSAKGMNYAIPANVAEKFLSHVINSTDIKSLDLGELNRYKNLSAASTYGLSAEKILDGVKLIADIISYVIGLFV